MLEKIFYGTGFGRESMSTARAGYLFVIWVLIPIWLVTTFYSTVVGLVFTGVSAGLGERLDADVSFRHPYFTWAGDVGLENLDVQPRDPDAQHAISMRVRRVQFDLPNLGVMLGLITADKGNDESEASLLRLIDHLDHVGVRIEGLQFDDFHTLPGVLAHVGPASAAPLEAEGCVGDVSWAASDLPALGISNDGIDISLTMANAPETHEVHITGELVSPHSSRAEFAQYFQAPSMSAFLDAPEGSRVATYERVAIQDEGFIKARDGYCAKRDGVAPGIFRERHLAAVRRLFEAQGMRPTEELEGAYRQYLQQGRLVLEARPNAHIRREDYHHYSVADQAKLYNGTLATGGKPVPVRFEETPSRAIPGEFDGSTWDLVASESEARGAVAGDDVVAVAPKPAPTATAIVPVTAPAVTPAAASSMVATTAMAGTSAQQVRATTPVAPLIDPDRTTRTTVDGRPLASSLPVAQQSSGSRALALDELPQHIGDYIQVTDIYGDKREGRLESVKGKSLNLKRLTGLGFAIQNIEFKQIREVLDVPGRQ